MTIKKQFLILAIITIIIPISCVICVISLNYIKSPARIFIAGSHELKTMNRSNFSPSEWNDFSAAIKSLPNDVGFVLISKKCTILLSTCPEFVIDTYISQTDIWKIIDNTSQKYFYQFTKLNEGNLLITRTDRNRAETHRKSIPLKSLIFFVFAIIITFVTFLVTVLLTISKSITVLEEQTQAIASGNLETSISSSNTNNTKQKKILANEITSISENFEKMRLSLLENQRQKNYFIMGMSHDLRTPVSIIKGYTEAIHDGIITDKEEIINALELINTKTNQLEDMITTMLNFMKLNSIEIRENLQPQSFVQFINDHASAIKSAGNVFKRNIVTDINLPEELLIPFDKQSINRAFENLFSNAIRYTEDNDTISLISYVQDNNIILKINDTGCGIEENALTDIFDLFYRATNSRREQGMGIGLAVVKSIMDTHGWLISVESKINEGTCFTITIPIPEQQNC